MTIIEACQKVANDWRSLAYAIMAEDAYASHVTDQQKNEALNKMLHEADEIENGKINNFTIAQRVNTYLTGECKPLFYPRGK